MQFQDKDYDFAVLRYMDGTSSFQLLKKGLAEHIMDVQSKDYVLADNEVLLKEEYAELLEREGIVTIKDKIPNVDSTFLVLCEIRDPEHYHKRRT